MTSHRLNPPGDSNANEDTSAASGLELPTQRGALGSQAEDVKGPVAGAEAATHFDDPKVDSDEAKSSSSGYLTEDVEPVASGAQSSIFPSFDPRRSRSAIDFEAQKYLTSRRASLEDGMQSTKTKRPRDILGLQNSYQRQFKRVKAYVGREILKYRQPFQRKKRSRSLPAIPVATELDAAFQVELNKAIEEANEAHWIESLQDLSLDK